MTERQLNHSLQRRVQRKPKADNCVFETVDMIEAQQITGMSANAIRNAFWTGKVAGRIGKTGRIYLSLASLLNHYPKKTEVSDVLGE
jgi:hypothetical protein